ncbi:MAG: glycosyltransferase family 39 protein [Taibaiella sp.]|nr:glycosyltransferase family 39 protein [Taibaiella sp.]
MAQIVTTTTAKSTAIPLFSPGSEATGENKIWSKVLVASLVVIVILMTVMSFSYGLSGDEVDMNEYGKAILKYFTTLGGDQTVFNMPQEFNRDGVIQYYGGFFDIVCAIANKVSPLGQYATRHMLNAWAGFLAIFFAARIAGMAFSKQAAVLCAWLMFLSPFFLGHAMNNPKDIPFATAYIASIYCIINLFRHLPKPRIKDYVYAILSIGITIDVRVGGILLIPYLFVFAAIVFVIRQCFQGQATAPKDWIKPLAIVAVLGYLAGSLFWPYGQKNPISNPLTALHEMSNFKVSILQLFEGTKVPSSELPANYLIKSFIITNSYVLLAGLILMAFFLWGARKRPMAAVIYFVVFTGLFPIFYIIYSKANVYHSWRHVMFAFPSLAIAAAGGWHYFTVYLAQKNFKYGIAVAGLLLIEPVLFIAGTFPNTVCYYNGFAGGVEGAYSNYEMDYYYNSVKQDAEWLKTNVIAKMKPTDTLVIGCNAAHLLSKYLTEYKNVRVDYVRFRERNQKQWDYSVFHIALIPEDEIKARTWLSVNTVFKAEVKGCPLSAVSKRSSYNDLKGFDALKENKVDSALGYFNNYLKTDADNIEMLSLMGNIYHQLKRDDIAGQYSARINKLMPAAE